MTQTRIAIGLVGYYQFIRGYPLGPELRERLENTCWHECRCQYQGNELGTDCYRAGFSIKLYSLRSYCPGCGS